MEFKNILYKKEDGIARITVNRPEVRNALNRATRQDIKSALEEVRADKSVRVLIITGCGDKAFIAGADINEFKSANPVQMEEMASTLGQQLYSEIENLDIPVIAMVNGLCLGGGCELAMACDIRIASESAKFGQPETNIGIIPGGGGTQRLPRLVGWGRAKELIYTGRIIDAAEAGRIGLADRVVPSDKLEETVSELARSVASKSPLIIKYAKRAINKGMYSDLSAGLGYEKQTFALCFATADQKEGATAFLEKRKPEFKGQ